VERQSLRHPLLYGEYEITIDEKNRLLVPSEIRKQIVTDRDGESLYVVVTGGIPWVYTERYYEDLANDVPADIAPGEDLLDFQRMKFGMASKVEPDKQGRVLIPEKVFRNSAGLGREITMLGVKDHLELWNRADWEAKKQALMARAAEVTQRARQTMQPPRAS
jgi:MraZ protein